MPHDAEGPDLTVPLARTPPLVLRGRTFDAGRPAVMAIVNRTPDSFYVTTGTRGVDEALAGLSEAVAAGADLVDVGGVRAGQEGDWVDVAEEVARVRPFLVAAREAFPDLLISLDTWRSEVLESCADVGIDLVNDTWAGADPDLAAAAAALGAGYVVSHTGGLPPRTDPVNISYGPDPDDVVASVLDGLAQGAQRAVDAGVRPEAVLVDPTLDFGKTTRNSLRVLRATGLVAGLGYPVLQAISRKDFVGETLGLPASERLEGSLAATAVAAWLGATVFRTHDVRATRRVLDMVASVRGDRPPAVAVRGEPASR
ncbi:MAG: dihydropteroate synthase [Propioniciclava sp.]|uniref:dihydropteroate synthase n=1 Tax=Propioniciclava sp. TaxID=2038686 RepID=UPI0039E7235F